MFNLTGWRTLSEVNAASGIPYEALRQTAKRASENSETWVKMNRLPRHWILNTDSEHFEQAITQVLALHSFSSQVTQDKAEDENEVFDDENDAYEDENDDDEACDFFLLDNKKDVLASPLPPLPPLPSLSASTRGMSSSLFSSAFFHDPTASLGHIWPELRQWLLDEGVLIFSNVLEADADRTWQWDWGNCGGVGYESIEKAVLGALQTKLKYSRDMDMQSVAACPEVEKDTRRHWFGRR